MSINLLKYLPPLKIHQKHFVNFLTFLMLHGHFHNNIFCYLKQIWVHLTICPDTQLQNHLCLSFQYFLNHHKESIQYNNDQCIKFMCTMCTVHNFIKLCTMRQIFLCRLCTKILNMMHKFDEKIVHCTIFCTISDSAQICTKMAQIPAQKLIDKFF